MASFRHNAGDIVRISRELQPQNYNGVSAIVDMVRHRGEKVTIATSWLSPNGSSTRYRLKELPYVWTDGMLESIDWSEEYGL